MMKSGFRILSAVLITLLFVSGCSTPEEDALSVVNNFLTAYQNLEFEKADTYVEAFNVGVNRGNGDTEENNEIMGMLFRNMKYEIAGVNEAVETGATVRVSITNIDMENVMNEYMKVMLPIAISEGVKPDAVKKSEGEIRDIGMDTMRDLIGKEKGRVTSEVEIRLTKSDGKSFKIVLDDELKNSLYGGLLKVTEKYDKPKE